MPADFDTDRSAYEEQRKPPTGGGAAPPPTDLESTTLKMPGLGSVDFSKLGLGQIIDIQDRLSRILRQRFERELGLTFTDIVGSTTYFQRFGNEAGRGLLERHRDLVASVVARVGGRIVDTAGDGAFCCFPSGEAGAIAMIDLQRRNADANEQYAREHRMRIRAGLHWGPVLTDGTHVTGDAVNHCARVASSAQAGDIRVSREAFSALPTRLRISCRVLPPAKYKGIEGKHEQWLLAWRDQAGVPRRILIEETAEEVPLPDLDVIRFGRLAEINGKTANEVVLELPDATLTQRISRWHFELERLEDASLVLHQKSEHKTEVDGVQVPKGGSAPVLAGTVVKIGGVLTIRFLADELLTTMPDEETIR